MVRTLVIIPRMYTKSEFKEAVAYVPEDYGAKSDEFWSYVTEKLRLFRGRIRKVFRESLSKESKEALQTVSADDERSYTLIIHLLEEGAEVKQTEDPILVAESESWLKMIKSSPNDTLLEFYEQSLAERNRYVANHIAQSLGDGEVGLLLIDSRHELELRQDIQVIKVAPSNQQIIWSKQLSRQG